MLMHGGTTVRSIAPHASPLPTKRAQPTQPGVPEIETASMLASRHALWRFVTAGEVPQGVVLRATS
jgi:hypothetical protein